MALNTMPRTREQVEANHSIRSREDVDDNWQTEVDLTQLELLREIACQLADLNGNILNLVKVVRETIR